MYSCLQNSWLATEKTMIFLPSFSWIFANLSSHFCSLCDTCDSKKTKSLLECARYAYARENFILNLPSLWPIKSMWLFCYVYIPYLMYWKKIMHFSPIFSLFGAISPHILIGGCETNIQRSSYFISLSRRKPIYQIHSPLCLFWHYYFVATFSSLPCARK